MIQKIIKIVLVLFKVKRVDQDPQTSRQKKTINKNTYIYKVQVIFPMICITLKNLINKEKILISKIKMRKMIILMKMK